LRVVPSAVLVSTDLNPHWLLDPGESIVFSTSDLSAVKWKSQTLDFSTVHYDRTGRRWWGHPAQALLPAAVVVDAAGFAAIGAAVVVVYCPFIVHIFL